RRRPEAERHGPDRGQAPRRANRRSNGAEVGDAGPSIGGGSAAGATDRAGVAKDSRKGEERVTTALIYVRQSRHKDYERTVSPDVQRDACAALPAVKACDCVVVFEDLDVSGGKRKRRGYDALLAELQNGDVSVVAAYEQSRLARSVWIWAEFQDLIYR